MFLRRVQVPNFRVLKDVDLTFEPEFTPRIFPLGSLNGGGKSTLLQLIFILLSCSGDPEKHIFIQNLLEGYKVGNESKKNLLSLELEVYDDNIKLDFVVYSNNSISNLLDTDNLNSVSISGSGSEIKKEYLKFSVFEKSKSVEQKILNLESEAKVLLKSINRLEKAQNIEDQDIREDRVVETIENLRKSDINLNFINDKRKYRIGIKSRRYYQDISYIDEILEEIRENHEEIEIVLNKTYSERDLLNNSIKRILEYLKSKCLFYISNFRNSYGKENALLLHIPDVDIDEANSLLQEISHKVYLAAPSTQIFLFTNKKIRQLLFKQKNNDSLVHYNSNVQSIKNVFLNFFTYDFLSVDILIESFKSARDKDFQNKIKHGEYGESFQKLLDEMNSLLANKKINLDSDLSGVNFKIETDNETSELYPEDLSHGELKRLGIYMWLKQRNIENSIVLIDEIENAFHPDWQYQIISDLAEWGASNQYILATHSYELCQALTPAHVKELEPKLLTAEQVEN